MWKRSLTAVLGRPAVLFFGRKAAVLGRLRWTEILEPGALTNLERIRAYKYYDGS
jgi:hypothetical protein